MNQTYIPSCLRNLPKQKAKPRKQAIKDAKAEVIDQAIQLLREELRSGKLEGMMMPYQRGYLSAISKLEVLKSELWTIWNFRIVQQEGSRQVERNLKHYNLQMIIAVGFKINNERAIQFIKWANTIVKDYTIKGWVMDDER